jgi:hypothetical protein
MKTSSCRGKGGQVDCNPGIQLAFSSTDKHDVVLNSWYEVSKLQQYLLFRPFSNLKESLTSPIQRLLLEIFACQHAASCMFVCSVDIVYVREYSVSDPRKVYLYTYYQHMHAVGYAYERMHLVESFSFPDFSSMCPLNSAMMGKSTCSFATQEL